MFALKYGFTRTIPVDKVTQFINELYQEIQVRNPEIIDEINTEKAISKELETSMKEVMKAFVEKFIKVNKEA